MEFSLNELNEIYGALIEQGGDSNLVIINKIETKYTFCHFCNNLILNEEFESHQSKHFEDE